MDNLWVFYHILFAVIFYGGSRGYYLKRNYPWEAHNHSFSATLTEISMNTPKFKDIPIVIGEEYKRIFLTCKAEEFSRITWKRNSKLLNVPPPYEIPWDGKGSILMIWLLPGRTDGVYECVVESTHSSETITKGVNVSIKPEVNLPIGFPKIMTHPSNILTSRKQIDFNCIVSGEAPVQISWYKDRKPVTQDADHQVSISMTDEDYSSNLMINNVSPDDKGFYQCIAVNKYGQVVSRQANINFIADRMPSVPRVRKDANNKEVTNVTLPDGFFILTNITIIPSNDIGNCTGADGDKGVVDFPGPLNISDPTCGYDPAFGKYMLLNWRKSGWIPKAIKSFDVTLRINDSYNHCLHLPPDRRAFMYSEKKHGFSIFNNYHFGILPRPVPIGYSYEMRPVDMIKCLYGDPPPPTPATSPPEPPPESKTVISAILGCGIGLTLIVLAFFGHRYFTAKGRIPPTIDIRETSIYISYCGDTRDDIEKVKKLAKYLNVGDAKLYVDLLYQTEIDQNGGFPFWIQKMQSADKIIMLITPKYLEAIKDDVIPEEMQYNQQILKVRNEYRSIVELDYFKQNINNSKLLIITDRNIKAPDLPQPFVNRRVLRFPKEFSQTDEDCGRIVGMLLGSEPTILEPAVREV